MPDTQIEFVSAIISLNGGEVVGKTRLQKVVFLLDAMGYECGAEFDYHNYGPYCSELAFATDDAEALGYITTANKQGYHAVPYTVFTSAGDPPRDWALQDKAEEIQEALVVMNGYSAIVLELAATAVYLRDNGYDDFWSEVSRRKATKASDARIEEAKRLIGELEV